MMMDKFNLYLYTGRGSPPVIVRNDSMETTDLIMKTLAESPEPMKAGEIAEAASLERKEVDKAMKVLKKEGRIVSPKVCYWTVP